MKNRRMTNRGIALLLTLAMLISCLPITAFAASEELSPESLRVSDEFAAQYPNGMLDIVNQNTITNEDSGKINFYIARRGGTDGEVDVSVKAIEMTAKYGEDFVFLEEGLFSSNEVEKVVDSPTLLESSIIDYGDEPITIDKTEIKENTDNVNDGENKVVNNMADKVTTENVDVATENQTTDGFDETREYASSLHKMRDAILNKNTTAEVTADTDLTKLFEVENEADVLRDEAMSAVMPGAFINLHFNEGENYKILTIKIIDDDIVEAEEAFMLGLFDCVGAELGNNATSSTCIKDNETKKENTQLYFENEFISAYDQNSTVRLKVMRSNNIETYQLLQIQTMGNTAKADINYSSLVTEAVLLAGQEYKYIDIPIIRADITDVVDFEIRVTGAECNEISATVTIYPTDTDGGIALMSNDIELMSVENQPKITIKGNTYNSNSYADSGRTYTDGWGGIVELNADNHRWGYLFYDVDLRGIEKVRVRAKGHWADTRYPKRVQHRLYIDGGNKTIEKQKNWDFEEFEFSSNNFPHRKTRFVAKAESWKWNDSRLTIDWIDLYKQKIILSYEQPDTFKIPIYKDNENISGYFIENGNEKVVALEASVSAINKDSSRPSEFYRDDTVTLTSTLSSDGKKYGAYLKGYELYNPATQTYKYFEGTDLTLTPEIIETYVYGDGKTYNSTLKIKPVYGRKSVESKLTLGNYALHKGNVSFANEILEPNIVKNYIKLTGYTNVKEWDDWRTVMTYPWMSVEEYDRLEEYYKDYSDFSGCFVEVKGEKTFENPKWCVGDYIAVTLNPADGYTANAINHANGNKISVGTSNTMYVQLKESGNYIMPVLIEMTAV